LKWDSRKAESREKREMRRRKAERVEMRAKRRVDRGLGRARRRR
jgi:hypothetical protein